MSQGEAVSQTVLNEFWLISDIFIEIFYLYGQSLEERTLSMVDDCRMNLATMAKTLRPYLKLNPLYSALMKSMGEINETHDFLVHYHGKKRKTAV
ncbi:MAG: hypothetical protein HZB31_02185 [Nitrospirae bacterium]|nr:hypothetical protein [Nitrospirota bacterium]